MPLALPTQEPVAASNEEVFRLAIVGCGPRGLYCLESLREALGRTPLERSVSVTIFEPSEFPGAGNVYDPRQPGYLRMNYAAGHINAWSTSNATSHGKLNLVDWLHQYGSASVGPHDFVGRADVGKYLHSCFQQVMSELSEHAATSLVPGHVRAISCDPAKVRPWSVREQSAYGFDEVLLTVGHEGWRQRTETHDEGRDEGREKFIPVFPTERHLRTERIAPRSTVAVRGFGLSCVDAALAMTEGRGGVFERKGGTWAYRPSGCEPQRLLPFSRSGRPMLAKPDESAFVQPIELEAIWERGRTAIERLSRPVGASEFHNVWRTVTEAAATAIDVAAGGACCVSPWMVQKWFERWRGGPMHSKSAWATIRQSYDVAIGQAAPDIGWALGAAWRNLYPALARTFSYGGLAEEAWPIYRQIGVEMERIAFGPPAENVGRLLALVEAGIIDLRFLTASLEYGAGDLPRQVNLVQGRRSVEVDAVVDAVIPSPLHVHPVGPLQGLLDDGVIQRIHGREGILVNASGRPIGASGEPIEGLAVLGRATEGCIVGNDSLSRTLHNHPERWARSVVQRVRSQQVLR